MGSAAHGREQSQALANKLIAVAELRKDCVACISPFRQAFLATSGDGEDLTLNSDTVTSAITAFYSSVTSSSYAILDSGYKYMYDRFSKAFRYVPLNGDIAGVCARNDINNFPGSRQVVQLEAQSSTQLNWHTTPHKQKEISCTLQESTQ